MAKLFFSYSHKDEALRNELETHLFLLRRQGLISTWHDRRILAGGDFNKSISDELESSQIILLLVSAYFLASDYCYEKEMTRAIEKHNDGSAVVIPVILHPCDWHSAPFGGFRATPNDGKAISLFPNLHEAFSIVSKDVREVAISFGQQIHPETSTVTSHLRVEGPRSSNLRVKRKFDDHERDQFLEDSFEYISRYFEGSLQELSSRHSHIKTRFKRIDAACFEAYAYDNGKRVAECSVWYGSNMFGKTQSIIYSHSVTNHKNSFNECLGVIDDGYTLQIKPMGISMMYSSHDKEMSQQGAAEYYWSLFIKSLQ